MTPRMGRQELLHAVEGYAATVLAVACALAIRLALDPLVGDGAPYIFFFLTIVIVARVWGQWPALFATLLGGLSAWYFIIKPRFAFEAPAPSDAINLIAYLAVGSAIAFLSRGSLRLPASIPIGRKGIRLRAVRQTAVLAGAAVVLAGMVLLLFRDFQWTREVERVEARNHAVFRSAQSLLAMMKDAEVGERSFLLTGDARYLAPYKAAVADIPRSLNELRSLTSNNPAQQARFLELHRLVGNTLAELQRTINLRTTMGMEAAREAIQSGQGDRTMAELHSVLNAVMKQERDRLVASDAAAEERASSGRWVLGLGSGALILLLVFASVAIERETDRREAITQALRRHADLLEQAHDSLFTCRLGGAIGYWSRGAEMLYGYTRAEALGRAPHELLQTSHPLGMDRIDALLEQNGEWKGELTQTTKAGRKIIVESKWTVATDPDGNKTVLEACRDITERKQAEAENLLLATAIEQAAESVVITDRDAKIQYVNPAFSRITGYSRDEAIGQNPRVLKSGLHDDAFYRELWANLTAGKLWRGEFTNRRKDGTLYHEEATIAPVRNPSGEITNYIAIKSDITKRKKRETALRENELMLRFFVQHAPAAIAMLDKEMRYLVVSQRWMSDYHLGDRNIEGLTHYEVFPKIPERWKEIYQRCLAGAVESFEEDSFRRPDGEIEWLRWEARPWPKADGSIGGITIVSELFTERKRAEDELQRLNVELEQRVRSRTAELESANRELEAFAHSVSHDLRAPLRGIDGWSLALQEDYGDRLDEQGHKYLNRVRSEAQRMGMLIDDLLQLSRVSRAELNPGMVDLTSLAEVIIARLRESHPDRHVDFMVAPRLQCTGDTRLLEIALSNLLDNAAKFTRLSARPQVEFGRTDYHGVPAFFVRDNGAGFDMAHAGMLFAPFQRLHKISEFPGTGIGLATVQRVIDRHGGHIWAEGRVGAGATFYFTLGADKE